MRIAHIFHSIDELENRISLRFRQRLDALLDAYDEKRYKFLKDTQIRAVCVAWAFLQLSLDGNKAMAADFHYMLHGERLEHIEYDNITLHYNDDTGTEEVLMWDIACLMLEEYVLKLPQFAFDIADRHAYLAYKLPQLPEPDADTTQAATEAQQPAPDAKPKQPATAAQQPVPIKKDAPQQEIQTTTHQQAVAQPETTLPDDVTEIKRLMEFYNKMSKEELVMRHMMKDAQIKGYMTMIDKLLVALGTRDVNNFYQGEIRTQINGGDIDMKNQTD